MKSLVLFLLFPLLVNSQNEKWWEEGLGNSNADTLGNPPVDHSGPHQQGSPSNQPDNIPPGGSGLSRNHPHSEPPVEILPHEFCDGSGTKCVPYYNCLDNGVIVDLNGIPTIGENYGKNCSLYLEVCCKGISSVPRPPPPHMTDPICSGQRNLYGADVRIANLEQKDTQYGEFPWMVAILRIENIGAKEINLYVCGGSIIGNDVILTAAHCVADQPPEKLKVRGGEWDTQQENEMFPHQERKVREIRVHPGYNNESLANNFALLFLDHPFRRNPAINTICLPSPQQVFENRTYCFATGWGKDKFGKEGQFQHILKKVELPYIPHGDCQDALKTTRLSKYFILDTSFMCAGGELGRDTCTGDGGSPLVCNLPGHGDSSTYFQVGIVSWGIGCGEQGIPGVYADVREGIDWIEAVLGVVPHT